jgi:hypothetical protein
MLSSISDKLLAGDSKDSPVLFYFSDTHFEVLHKLREVNILLQLSAISCEL